ncbi:MAG: twin-arginine translocase TatA/TatE family subunit [Thermoplasmatota archaeon]
MAFGAEDWLVILLAVVILFGGSTQIPKLARSLGRARGEFARGKMELEAELRAGSAPPTPASDEQLRATARSLGIDDAGKSSSDLKRLIQEKLA